MDQREFLIQHLIEGRSYPTIEKETGVSRIQLQQWWMNGTELRQMIQRSNQLFDSRVKNENFRAFKELGKRRFFEWYESQPKTCYYCGISQEKLAKVFSYSDGILFTKRGRGRVLELERIDAEENDYSPENCTLACYVCNNHKSDLISAKDHRSYFASQIRAFLEDKYAELEQNQK